MGKVLNRKNVSANILTLEEVSKEYSILLFDTCALSGILSQDPKNMQDRILNEETQTHSAIFLRKSIEQDKGFYVTEKILEEYSEGLNYNYKKRYKKIFKENGKISKERLNLLRKIKDKVKEKRKLVNLLKESGKILSLREKEKRIYRHYNEKYSSLIKPKGIGSVDFDFLISGAILAEMREPTCLITNDTWIIEGWKRISRLEKISEERFGFFIRQEFNGFQRDYVKKYK